jgi:O-antigen/teichoic acid export membrane protein
MTHSEHGKRRDRSIRLAVGTSLLSKVGMAALQLLSIPIAIRVLGRAEFGLYTSVSLTLTMLSLFEIGVGPALAHGLAKANAEGDKAQSRVLASTSFFLMAGIALLIGIVGAVALSLVPLGSVYGEAFEGREGVLRPALWVGLGLSISLFLFNLTERIREGFLEVAVTNACGAVGNLTAAVVVGIGVWKVPEVWFLVLAIHGALLLAKMANTALLWRKRPEMVPSWKFFRPGMAKHLLGDGLAFSTCCLMTGIVEFNLAGWMVGRQGGPSAVALYGVLVSLTVMQAGFVFMISTPTWPAVAEALARGDREWARKAARRFYGYGGGFALLAAVGLTVAGPWVFSWWLGEEFAGIGHGVFACYGFYFAAHIWRHLNHTLMIGTGQVTKMARPQLIESAMVAVAAWMGLAYGGLEVMLLAMGAVIFLMTGRILPGMVRRVLGPSEFVVPPSGGHLKAHRHLPHPPEGGTTYEEA